MEANKTPTLTVIAAEDIELTAKGSPSLKLERGKAIKAGAVHLFSPDFLREFGAGKLEFRIKGDDQAEVELGRDLARRMAAEALNQLKTKMVGATSAKSEVDALEKNLRFACQRFAAQRDEIRAYLPFVERAHQLITDLSEPSADDSQLSRALEALEEAKSALVKVDSKHLEDRLADYDRAKAAVASAQEHHRRAADTAAGRFSDLLVPLREAYRGAEELVAPAENKDHKRATA